MFGANEFDGLVADPLCWMHFCRELGDLRDIIHLTADPMGFLDMREAFGVQFLVVMVCLDGFDLFLNIPTLKSPQVVSPRSEMTFADAMGAISLAAEDIHERWEFRRGRHGIVVICAACGIGVRPVVV